MTPLPPRILIAPDSFKGSLSAQDAALAIAEGLRQAMPAAVTRCIPMADGGEGTLEALWPAGYQRQEVATQDALGRSIQGHYGLDASGRRAVVELAMASGLPQLRLSERDPLAASTEGTGLLLRRALETLGEGNKEALLCVGGSATTDAGTGLLRALGWRFLDSAGRDLAAGGAALIHLAQIVPPREASRTLLRDLTVNIACDVTNPLTGPQGAATVYGPQKGADPDQVRQLDSALEHFACVAVSSGAPDIRTVAGAGAAGGTAGGLLALLPAAGVTVRLQSGAALVAQANGLQTALQHERWDIVFTGEGQLDAQSSQGKVVAQVAQLAAQQGVPCVALCGRVQAGAVRTVGGLNAAFALASGPLSLTQSQQQAAPLLTAQAEQLGRFWQAARK